MRYLTRSSALRVASLSVLAVALAACHDGGPVSPEQTSEVLGEAALDAAAAEVGAWEQGTMTGPGTGQGSHQGQGSGWGHGQGSGGMGNGGMGNGGQGNGGMGNGGQGTGGMGGAQGHGGGPYAWNPDLAVGLGAAAVALATDLLDAPDAEQLALLAQAQELQAEAVEALAAGAPGQAVALANRAVWTSLKAVVLTGGVTLDEARTLQALATDLLASALAAVGEEPTDLEAHLLLGAEHMLDRGAWMLDQGAPRAVAPLWKAAVILSWLAGT